MPTGFSGMCRLLSLCALVGLILAVSGIVLLTGLAVLSGVSEVAAMRIQQVPGAEALAGLNGVQRLIVLLLAAAVIVPLAVALAAMRGLFEDFAGGHVFTPRSAAGIRRIGQMLLVGAVLTVFVNAARSVATTYANAPGERSLAIALGSHEMTLMLLGGLLVVIGQAMAEAAKIDAENRAFI